MEKADFGFQVIDKKDKEHLVQQVFSNVATKYDVMNDFMSFGLHHLWKDRLMDELYPHPDAILIDVATGTGDIGKKFIEAGGGKAYLCDLNPQMLREGQRKMKTSHPTLHTKMVWQCANAEALPYEDDSFDYYTISFGIRNVTNIDKALAEAFRVLKRGGKFICLELSDIEEGLIKKLYDLYSFKLIPKIGKAVADNPGAYTYLVESIRKFPKPQRFAQMLEEAGLYQVRHFPLTFGVVSIHTGYKV